MRRLGVRDLPVRFGLGRVDEVGELDPVADEEDRHIVADEIEHTFDGIEFDREAPHDSYRVGRSP